MSTENLLQSVIVRSSSNPLLLRLQESLNSCANSVEANDFSQTDKSVSELVHLLNSFTESLINSDEVENSTNSALQVLFEIHQFVYSSSTSQAVIDAISLELPKVIAKFATFSNECLKTVDSIIERFIETCSPRDMLSILCEALDSPGETFQVPGYFAPLLSGVSKVVCSIKRRQFEQVKEAIPIILKVLKTAAFDSEDGDHDIIDFFQRAISIAKAMQGVGENLDSKTNERLCALLALFVLQVMALLSFSMGFEVSSFRPLVVQLLSLLPYCGLSFLGSITGSDVEAMTGILLEEGGDDYMGHFSYVKHGASLTVIWGHVLADASQSAAGDLSVLKNNLREDQVKRWEAIGMLKHIFSSTTLPWILKKHGIDLILSITEGNISCDDHMDCSTYIPGLFTALKAVEMVMMFASDAVLRRNSYKALKRVIADIPTSQRFDVLKALITDSTSSSMIALLVDCVREEMHKGKRTPIDINAHQNTSFWSDKVLELVAFVLRPPRGGPPSLPEDSDAVLSVLNLYKYLLLTESAEKTNFTGALSENNLRKAYNDWLLPLRTLVTGFVAENRMDPDQHVADMVCSLNPVEMILYECIELVEQKLRF